MAMSGRAQQVAMTSVTGLAMVLSAAGQLDLAYELAAFVGDNVSTDKPTRDRAARLLDDLAANLPAATIAAAGERGKARRLRDVARQLTNA